MLRVKPLFQINLLLPTEKIFLKHPWPHLTRLVLMSKTRLTICQSNTQTSVSVQSTSSNRDSHHNKLDLGFGIKLGRAVHTGPVSHIPLTFSSSLSS